MASRDATDSSVARSNHGVFGNLTGRRNTVSVRDGGAKPDANHADEQSARMSHAAAVMSHRDKPAARAQLASRTSSAQSEFEQSKPSASERTVERQHSHGRPQRQLSSFASPAHSMERLSRRRERVLTGPDGLQGGVTVPSGHQATVYPLDHQRSVEATTLPDGTTHLRLLSSQSVEDTLVEEEEPVEPSSPSTSGQGSPVRRLVSIAPRPPEPEGFGGMLEQMMQGAAYSALHEREIKMATTEKDRIQAWIRVINQELMVLQLEDEYDALFIDSQGLGDPERLLRLSDKERRLAERRLLYNRNVVHLRRACFPPGHPDEEVDAMNKQLVQLDHGIRTLESGNDDAKEQQYASMHDVEHQLGEQRRGELLDPDVREQRLQEAKERKLEHQHQLRCQLYRLESLQARMQTCKEKLELVVRPDEIMLDTRVALAELPSDEWRKRLMIKFKGQDGQDLGGLVREWMGVMATESVAAAVKAGALIAANEHGRDYVIRPCVTASPEMLAEMKFLGQIIGLGLLHGLTGPFALNPVFFKLMQGGALLGLEDLKQQDPTLGASMHNMLDTSGVEDWEMAFETTIHQRPLAPATVELIENGSRIPITDSNKQEYVQALLDFRYSWGVASLLEKLLEGVTSFVPMSRLSSLSPELLQLLVCGKTTIDVMDWKSHTAYTEGYTEESSTVQWFWSFVDKADIDMKRRLLAFATGCSTVPTAGFAGLHGMQGSNLFTLARAGDASTFPVAHTCMNRIDMPEYGSEEELHAKLQYAIMETEGFHLA